MKRVLSIFVVAVLIASFGFYQYSKVEAKKTEENIMTDKKILIAYYSHSGNTKAVAEKIKNVTGGDIVEIIPEKPYPNGYNELVELAKVEKTNNVMPKIKPIGKNVADYDVVFVGTPVWWYTMASPVKTFIADNNFDGKTIAPFCTHGGGGESATFTDMKKLAPNATVKTGFSTYERTANDKNVADWIKSLNL